MYIITLLSTYILVSMIYTIYSNKQWNEDHKCEIILSGGLKEYNQLLDYNKYVTYNNFDDKIKGFEFIYNRMITFNKECKDFNKSEETIIKQNYKKALSNFTHSISP